MPGGEERSSHFEITILAADYFVREGMKFLRFGWAISRKVLLRTYSTQSVESGLI